MRKISLFILSCMLLSFSNQLAAKETPLASFTFDSIVSKSGGRVDPTPLPKVDGLSFDPFTAVPASGTGYGLSETPSAAKIFAFTGWPVLDTVKGIGYDMDASQYYTFKIKPLKGTVYRIDRIVFKILRTSTGPVKYAVRASHDGFAANLTASIEKATEGNASIDDSQSISLADKECTCQFSVNVGQEFSVTEEFRFYAWQSELQSAPFKLGDVLVYGKVLTVGSESESEPSASDTTISIGSDTLSFQHGLTETWRTSFSFNAGGNTDSMVQKVSFARGYFDAAIELCNMHDSLSLMVEEVQLRISDSTGYDVTQQFLIHSSIDKNIQPLSSGILKFRVIPQWQLSAEENFTLQGTVMFTDPFDGLEKTTLLYPSSVSLHPEARCEASYFVPVSEGMPIVLQVRNISDNVAAGVEIISELPQGTADTVQIGQLPARGVYQYVSSIPSDSALWGSYSYKPLHDAGTPDSMLSESPLFHRLMKTVSLFGGSNDTLPDMLVDDSIDGKEMPDLIYTSEGEHIAVLIADSFMTDVAILPARDSVAEFSLDMFPDGWNYARTVLPLSMQKRDVLAVERLDSSNLACGNIPLDNVWTTEQRWLHLVDNLYSDDTVSHTKEKYRIKFSTLELPAIVTEVSDSICLGDSYYGYGFDLPSFNSSGDYSFADTMLAVNGADSIVQLALNVCSKPSSPGRIVGDSVVVKAGNFQYTISPVPQAAFYVWTVFPSAWQLTGTGETVSLNVPYNGKGVLSVRAVNRCGASEATTLNLSTESMDGAFVVYPDEQEGDFILETAGIEGKTVIAVSDLTGKLIYKEEKDLSSADNTFRFSLSSKPDGVYIISIVNKNLSVNKKLQK